MQARSGRASGRLELAIGPRDLHPNRPPVGGPRNAHQEVAMTMLAPRMPEPSMTFAVQTEIAVVLGTRSEAVKLAPVVRALRRTPGVRPLVVSTGQHRELLDQVLRPLGVRPDVDLAVLDPGQPLPRLTARVVEQLGELLAQRRPAAVIVHGDSTTAFGGALAAFSEGIPVGHVGAGLRSGMASDPFPEEANRRLIAPLARWHLAPTVGAAANLIAEGVESSTVTVTGNTGIDSLTWAADLQRGTSAFRGRRAVDRAAPRLLVTLHRRENGGGTMRGLAGALRELAADGADVVVPLHPSPAVREVLLPALEGSQVRVVESLGYLDFVATLADSTLVITDSGGVQEEAPTLGKPALVVRELTERPEGPAAGVARLIGTDPQVLLDECRALLADVELYAQMSRRANPYGDGHAAERVVETVCRSLVPCWSGAN
jgi:UDP-N-acetylglucosamine 2-epimerase (non-hydrolysing)